MPGEARGRITVPDVLYVAATVFFFGALGPVFLEGLNSHMSDMNEGTVWLFRLLLPLLVLVFFSAIYLKAVGGK